MKNKKKYDASKICFIVFFLLMVVLFVQYAYLSLSTEVYGINIKEFALNRNTVTSTLTAKRGTIYDISGNILAENISTYTLIAYLDSSRETDYVVDKEYTAYKLSTILGEENYDYILKRLNKDSKQVEFGSVGKNLTELTKLAIEELELEGIDFEEKVQRYYPNGDFASYIIGYAKQYSRINIKENENYDLYSNYSNYFNNYDNVTIVSSNEKVAKIVGNDIIGLKLGKSYISIKSNNDVLVTLVVNVSNYEFNQILDLTIVGELGIESKYNNILEGTDGYIKYEQDKYGYKIPDTNEEKVEAVDGSDIYLTIDSNIQRFAESAVQEIIEDYSPEYSAVMVMDAKSGDILASATNPSFNPNNLTSDMSYQNPLVSYTYEPGSVMKIYTYMCAIETGNYDGTKGYLSGEYEFEDGTVMHDWNKKGWGILSYDTGFSYSSNTAIINIINDYLSRDKLRECLESYGFGQKTGIELSQEQTGSIEFKYETEIMSAGFGQGISITPIQQLQALTIIANDGYMLKPHIISKIVNNNTNEVTETKIEKSNKLVSSTTVNKIKDLMESVISPDSPTGSNYYLEGYDLIGKTGTAQIYSNGAYLTGENDYIVSVALMYPKDDPEIIIYAIAKRPESNANQALANATKNLIKNISKYKAMSTKTTEENNNIIEIDNYINKYISDINDTLKAKGLNTIILGDGNIIIDQYPKENIKLVKGDKIFLKTNSDSIKMIDITSWSKGDVNNFCNISNIKCNYNGYGYVTNQNISSGTILNSESVLEVTLEDNLSN